MAPALSIVPSDDAALSHNLNGQKLGRKGRVTRERILAAATELIEEGGEAQLSLSAVARRCKLGMTSLYNYFADLTELLQALLEPVMAEAEGTYLHYLREYWEDDEVEARATQFLESYFSYWERHARILHIRNAMAETYDERMLTCRVSGALPLIELLRLQLAGRGHAVTPRDSGMGSVLVTGIERATTLVTNPGMPVGLSKQFVPRRDSTIESLAQLLTLAIRESRIRHQA